MEVDDSEIAGKLGQLVAGQQGIERDIGHFREEARKIATDARDSRRQLYKSIEDLKDKFTSEVNEVKIAQKLLDMRAEDTANVVRGHVPNILDIPVIRTAVKDLEAANLEIKTSLNALTSLKNQLEGAAKASKMWWAAIWTGAMILGGLASAAVTAAWHYFITTTSPPGR